MTAMCHFEVSTGKRLPGQGWLMVGHEPGYSWPQAQLLGGGYPPLRSIMAVTLRLVSYIFGGYGLCRVIDFIKDLFLDTV